MDIHRKIEILNKIFLMTTFFCKLLCNLYIMLRLYPTLSATGCTCNIHIQCNPLVAFPQWHSYFRWFRREHLVEILHRTLTPSKTSTETLSGTSFRRLTESASVIRHVTPDVMGEAEANHITCHIGPLVTTQSTVNIFF